MVTTEAMPDEPECEYHTSETTQCIVPEVLTALRKLLVINPWSTKVIGVPCKSSSHSLHLNITNF